MKKVKKYQSKVTSGQTKSDTTKVSNLKVKRDDFYINVENAKNIDPKFAIDPKKVGAKTGDIDPGFSKGVPKKKLGGANKKKK